MELCDACEDLAKALSVMISGGQNHPSSRKPIRHGRDLNELNPSKAWCRFCRLLSTCSSLEDPFKGPTEGYAIEVLPVWSLQDGLDSANSRDKSRQARKILRWLHIFVRRERVQVEEEKPQSSEKKGWPTVLQIYGLRGDEYLPTVSAQD